MTFYWYALLTVATTVIVLLAGWIWWRTREPGFLIGILFLYFWSLWGAWFLVHDEVSGVSIMHYRYLFHEMFAVALDPDYAYALELYAIFIIVVEVTVLCVLVPRNVLPAQPPAPLVASHTILLVTAALSV